MQSITQSAVQERLVMEEELKKALDRCKELEQSSVPAVDGVDIFECYKVTGEGRVLETGDKVVQHRTYSVLGIVSVGKLNLDEYLSLTKT